MRGGRSVANGRSDLPAVQRAGRVPWSGGDGVRVHHVRKRAAKQEAVSSEAQKRRALVEWQAHLPQKLGVVRIGAKALH